MFASSSGEERSDEIPESEGRLSAIDIAGLLPYGQSGGLTDKVAQ